MPSHCPSAMLTEMEGLNRIFVTVDITLGGSVHKFAPETVASLSAGEYLSYLVNVSGLERSVDTMGHTLQIPQPSIEIFDFDRTIQKAVGGPLRGKVRGSSVEIWYRSFHVAAASHYQVFDGAVLDYGLSSDRTWTFELTPSPVQALLGELKIQRATRSFFATMPAKFEGHPMHLILGRHHSAGTTVTGAVPCFPIVENAAGECIDWAVSIAAVEVLRIFRNDVEDTANWNGGWSLLRGDQLIRTIRFTGGGAKPTADDAVTVDCNGLSQSSPHNIDDYEHGPTAAIIIVLQQFAFGDGSSAIQAWPAFANFDTTRISETAGYFDVRSVKVGRVVPAGTKAIDFLSEMCDSFDMYAWFTDEYKIAFGPEDEADVDIYHDDRLISDRMGHALGPISMSTARSKPVSEISTDYMLMESEGDFQKSSIVSDPSVAETVKEDFQQTAGAAAII